MVHMVKSWLCIADSLLTEVLDIPVCEGGTFRAQPLGKAPRVWMPEELTSAM